MDKFTDQLNPRSRAHGCARRGAGRLGRQGFPPRSPGNEGALSPCSDSSLLPGLAASGAKTVMLVVEAFHAFMPSLQPEELPVHQKPVWVKELGTKYSH